MTRLLAVAPLAVVLGATTAGAQTPDSLAEAAYRDRSRRGRDA